MSGGGGGMGGMIQNLYGQLPQNVGGTGSYPGMPQNTNPMAPQNYNYGQGGDYNTLAQDMQQGQFGQSRFSPTYGMQYQGAGMSNTDPRNQGYFQYSSDPNRNPNAYQPGWGGQASGQRGTYTPGQTRGGASFPGFGQGGMPGRFNNAGRGGGRGQYERGGQGMGGGFQNYNRMQQGGAMGYGNRGGFQSNYYGGGAPQVQNYPSPFGGMQQAWGGDQGMTKPQFPMQQMQMPFGGAMTGTQMGGGQEALAAQAMQQYQNPQMQAGMQDPRSVQPAQQVEQYRNYRSPFAGGGQQTQYGPQMQGALW